MHGGQRGQRVTRGQGGGGGPSKGKTFPPRSAPWSGSQLFQAEQQERRGKPMTYAGALGTGVSNAYQLSLKLRPTRRCRALWIFSPNFSNKVGTGPSAGGHCPLRAVPLLAGRAATQPLRAALPLRLVRRWRLPGGRAVSAAKSMWGMVGSLSAAFSADFCNQSTAGNRSPRSTSHA